MKGIDAAVCVTMMNVIDVDECPHPTVNKAALQEHRPVRLPYGLMPVNRQC